MNSTDIYEIPEINNIISNYVDQLFQNDHSKKFKNCLTQINGLWIKESAHNCPSYLINNTVQNGTITRLMICNTETLKEKSNIFGFVLNQNGDYVGSAQLWTLENGFSNYCYDWKKWTKYKNMDIIKFDRDNKGRKY